MAFSQRLVRDHYSAIQQSVRALADADGLDGLFLDHHEDVAYLTGFFHHPCERPVAVWLGVDGESALLIPKLEEEHAQWQNAAADLIVYPEYPGVVEPLSLLADRFRGRRVGIAPSTSTGRVEILRSLVPEASIATTLVMTTARSVKTAAELVLHQEAARITDLMLQEGVRLVREGLDGGELPTEAELASHLGGMGVRTMYEEHSDVVVTGFLAGGLVYSGPNSARPHGLPSGYRLRAGEPFMLSLGCAVGGRFVEGERTFLLGEPPREQVERYESVLAAHEAGLGAIRPGVSCAEANRICLDVIREAGLANYLQHRQGHGIGLGMHEPPWLEDGDETVIREGFVLSNEPGIYIPGHAGYRISDSVLVTSDGARPLTTYPKSLDSIVVAA